MEDARVIEASNALSAARPAAVLINADEASWSAQGARAAAGAG
jgi:hypothetical protein